MARPTPERVQEVYGKKIDAALAVGDYKAARQLRTQMEDMLRHISIPPSPLFAAYIKAIDEELELNRYGRM